MAVAITRGTNDAPVASEVLAEVMAGLPGLSGKLFLGYPVVATLDGPLAIDALWASPEAGFVLFDLVEGTEWAGHDCRQDNLGNVVEGEAAVPQRAGRPFQSGQGPSGSRAHGNVRAGRFPTAS